MKKFLYELYMKLTTKEINTYCSDDYLSTSDPKVVFRAEETARFIDKLNGTVIDMGKENIVKKIIADKLGIEIRSFHADFDDAFELPPCDAILCLETLEHLLNPLNALQCMARSLREQGSLYLSTPYRPHWLWSPAHFHEFDDRRIRFLFKQSGFRKERMNHIPLRKHKFPFWKSLNSTRIYELSKIAGCDASRKSRASRRQRETAGLLDALQINLSNGKPPAV